MYKISKHFNWVKIVSIALCLFFFTGTLDLFAAVSSGGRSSMSMSSPKTFTPAPVTKSVTTVVAKKSESGGISSMTGSVPAPKPSVTIPPSPKPDIVVKAPSKPVQTGPVPSGGASSMASSAPIPVQSVSRPQIVPVRSVSEVRTVYKTAPVTWVPPVYVTTSNHSYLDLYFQLSVINAMTNAAERAEMRRTMMSNPSYNAWQAEASQQAAQNAELRRELNTANSVRTGMGTGSILLLILVGSCIVGGIVWAVRKNS